MQGTASSVGSSFVVGTGTAAASTGITTSGIPGDPAMSQHFTAEEMVKKHSPSMKKANPDRRKLVIRVVRSPKGHRVKLVGGNLAELAPIFVRWADRLDRDLRVVVTGGDAPYQFYGRPMVESRLKDSICLFLTGSMDMEGKDDGGRWRVGVDEIMSLKAPAKLDSPEFPAYANIVDEKKTFIGRVEGKFIYTMLYIPMKAAPSEKLPSGLIAKAQYVEAPAELDPFIEHVLIGYERMMKRHGAEIRGELTGLSFREFCGDSRRRRERTLREAQDKIGQEIREIEQKMMKKARELRENQKDLALVMSGGLDAELAKESDKLSNLVDQGIYEKFKVRHGRIVGMTAPITIEHEGNKFDLGQFVVSIKKDGTVDIEHPTKAPPFHPHIHTEGRLCLGSYRDDLHKLIGLERYALVFQVLYEFLNTYTPNDRFNKIEVCAGLEEAQNVPQATQAGAVPERATDIQEPAERGNASEDFDRTVRAVDQGIRRAVGIPSDMIRSDLRTADQTRSLHRLHQEIPMQNETENGDNS